MIGDRCAPIVKCHVNMILPVARFVVAAFAANLAYNTGRNVFETVQISRLATTSKDAKLKISSSIPTSIAELESMSRQEVLHLYIDHCVVPSDMSAVDGEWHGKLLNNNGLVCFYFSQSLLHGISILTTRCFYLLNFFAFVLLAYRQELLDSSQINCLAKDGAGMVNHLDQI